MTFLYHKLSENLRGIFPEKYRYFLKNSQEISGNFPSYSPSFHKSHTRDAGHCVWPPLAAAYFPASPLSVCDVIVSL